MQNMSGGKEYELNTLIENTKFIHNKLIYIRREHDFIAYKLFAVTQITYL